MLPLKVPVTESISCTGCAGSVPFVISSNRFCVIVLLASPIICPRTKLFSELDGSLSLLLSKYINVSVNVLNIDPRIRISTFPPVPSEIIVNVPSGF